MKNMKIICNPSEISPVALAIGNFDGVHLGHKAIISKARKVAADNGLQVAVMTFEPHPRMFFQREKAPKRISLFKQKMQLLEANGIDICYVLKFNANFARLPATEFVQKYLAGNHVITGADFAFGADRGGDAAMLQEMLGDKYHIVAPFKDSAEIVSSSRIRAALQAGDVKDANALLGHEFSISAKVQRGAGNGTKLGFPTANLQLKKHQLRPKYGVYAVETNFGSGVANFGVRPTLDGKTELLEVHIFNFSKDIYGQDLQVKFNDYIREEMHFADINQLKEQIEKDVEIAQKFIN